MGATKALEGPSRRPTVTTPLSSPSRADEASELQSISRSASWNGPLVLVCAATVMIVFNDVARLGEWSVSDWLYVLAACVVVMALLAGRTRHLAPTEVRRTAPVLLATSLVLLTAGTLSTLWAVEPIASMMVVIRFGWVTLAWFWVVRAVAVSRWALGRVVWAYKVAVLIGAATAILGDMGVPISPNNWGGRQAGYWGHPNSLAAFLLVGVPFFLLDVPRSPDRPRGRPLLVRLGLTGFVLVAIGTTGSMTGWVGALVGIVTPGVVFVFAADRDRLRFRPLTAMVAVAVVAGAMVAFFSSDAQVVERLSAWRTGGTYVSNSVESRSEHTDVVLRHIDQRLILGVGFDRESTLVKSGVYASTIDNSGGIHNMLLKLTYEAGVPACAAVLVLLAATAGRAWRLLLHTRGTELYPMVLALFGAFAAINVNAQFQPVLFRRYYWFPVAVIWALYALCRYESRKKPEGSHVRYATGRRSS
jgi:hypothetical protein